MISKDQFERGRDAILFVSPSFLWPLIHAQNPQNFLDRSLEGLIFTYGD